MSIEEEMKEGRYVNSKTQESVDLKFCSNGHVPIWFTNHYCPHCHLQIDYHKALKQIDDKSTKEELQKKIKRLERDNRKLKRTLKNLKSEIMKVFK